MKHNEAFLADILEQQEEKSPPHPGEVFKEAILPALNLTVSQAAKEMKVSRQALYRILSKCRLSPEMALRFGQLCGNGPDAWLEVQKRYDIFKAKKKISSEISQIPVHPVKVQI